VASIDVVFFLAGLILAPVLVLQTESMGGGLQEMQCWHARGVEVAVGTQTPYGM